MYITLVSCNELMLILNNQFTSSKKRANIYANIEGPISDQNF